MPVTPTVRGTHQPAGEVGTDFPAKAGTRSVATTAPMSLRATCRSATQTNTPGRLSALNARRLRQSVGPRPALNRGCFAQAAPHENLVRRPGHGRARRCGPHLGSLKDDERSRAWSVPRRAAPELDGSPAH